MKFEGQIPLPAIIRKLWGLILVLAVLSVYSHTLSYPLSLLDELSAIVENTAIVRSLIPPFRLRWLVDMSFRLNYHLTLGLNPADFRIVNILIHIFASICLYGVLNRTLSAGLSGKGNNTYFSVTYMPMFLSLLWAVHPIHTSAVTYVCQRYESMMGAFYLLTLYLFSRSLMSQRHKRLWFDLSLVSCVLTMLTKEVSVTLPVILLAYDWVFGESLSGNKLNSRFSQHSSYFLTYGVFIVAFIGGVALEINAGRSIPSFSFISRWEYLRTQAVILLHYLKLVVLPYPLCFDYAWQIEKCIWIYLPATLMITVLFVCSILFFIRKRPIGYAGIWFFIILAPTSSVFPLADLAFEHRMYLPSVAVLCVAIFFLKSFFIKFERHLKGSSFLQRLSFCVFMFCIYIVFSFLTFVRNLDYSSPERMWNDTVKKSPRNWRAYLNLAAETCDKNAYEKAITYCNKILNELPRERITNGNKIVEVFNPQNTRIYSRAHELLGTIYDKQNDYDKAEYHYLEALNSDENNSFARLSLGLMYVRMGKRGEGIAEIKNLTDSQTNWAEPYFWLGKLEASSGDHRKAVDLLSKTILMDPNHLKAIAELAWLLATSPFDDVRDGRKSLLLGEELLRKSGNSSIRALEIIAAAKAELGDFITAVEYEKKALALFEQQRKFSLLLSSSFIEEAQKRQNMYKSNKPYRELIVKDEQYEIRRK
ncbi:TPA: tetratricopeptide repeat protein [bacterium]|nr:tetratricopeptide repeat protein [bacterium]